MGDDVKMYIVTVLLIIVLCVVLPWYMSTKPAPPDEAAPGADEAGGATADGAADRTAGPAQAPAVPATPAPPAVPAVPPKAAPGNLPRRRPGSPRRKPTRRAA